MKKLLPLFIFIVFLSACKNTWDDDDKAAFYQSCMDDANTWAGSKEQAKTYCDCVMEKVLKKYPNESDVLEHMDSVINDPDLKACRQTVTNQ